VAGIVIVSVRQASGLSPWAPEAVVTRRLGRRTEPAIQKISQLEPPRTWAWHAGGGPVRGGSGGRSEAWASSGLAVLGRRHPTSCRPGGDACGDEGRNEATLSGAR
jgi:hypothetical protein